MTQVTAAFFIPPFAMVEVQAHGFTFEKWVRNVFFEGYEGNYMQKWDVPPDMNRAPAIPPQLRHLPVSIKSAKYGSPIGLGDVLRQRQTDLDFLLITGFWRQRSSDTKWIEEIGVARITASVWASLWGDVSLEQLLAIDRVVKDMELPHTTARLRAREWKQSTAAVRTARLVINPKIDSKTQRRIQCSLPFSVFWPLTGREPQPGDQARLWEIPFPNPIKSAARKFNP